MLKCNTFDSLFASNSTFCSFVISQRVGKEDYHHHLQRQMFTVHIRNLPDMYQYQFWEENQTHGKVPFIGSYTTAAAVLEWRF